MNHQTPLARAISLIIATAAVGANQHALAQAEQPAAQQAAAQDQSLETVVVTGSRIRHDSYSSAQPMDVVSPDVAALQGFGDVTRLLQSSTIASGSPQVTSATSTAFVQNGGTGAQTLSLRGLGANRTLVLLNGRRAGPAGVRGAVSSFDFNVLPLSVIERIEILKDGASSIYGSDAVAGVVNIITKKGEGATVDAYLSQPQEDGGEETRVNASWGKTYSRGNFRVTADYFKEDELRKGDRKYFSCGEQYIFDPETGERADVIDPRTGSYRCADLLWGQVWIYDYQDEGGNVPPGAKAQYDYDGDLGNYIPGFAVDPDNPDYMVTPPGWYPVAYDRPSDGVANADHPFQDGSSLNPEMERFTFYAEGEFEIDDNVTAYAEVLLNRRETRVNGYRQYWSYIYNEENGLLADPPYEYGTNPLSVGWTGAQWLSPTPITDHSDSEVTVDYRRIAAGLRGNINKDWSWDVSLQTSRSDGEYIDDQIFDDSISPYNFGTGSCVGELTPVRGAPCVDVPWLDPEFLRGNVSQEVRDFLFGQEKGTTTYDQWSIEAFVTGPVAELPAGPVGFAFGAHYQYDQIEDTPGEITRAGNSWGNTAAGVTRGDDTMAAVFAEVEVPLLRGLPMVERLTLNASGRYTDVASYGSDETYKLSLDWAIVPSLRLRATQGTSFRTPALYELYLADQTSFIGQRSIDPCINWGDKLSAGSISQQLADNCAADGVPSDYPGGSITATVFNAGAYGRIEAETSTSRTVGLVWQPDFTDLSVSVDYFDIEVKDEVDLFGPGNIVFGCYDSDFFPDEPLCDQFERTGFDTVGLNLGIDNVHDDFVNIAEQTNKGWDLAATWRTSLPWGELTLETQHTWQTEDKKGLYEQTVEDFNGEIGDPEWVGRFSANFAHGPWSFFWGTNFIGASDNYESYGGNTAEYRDEVVRVVLETDTVMYHSTSVSYLFDQWGLTARVGISNVFDEEPPRLTTLNLGEVDTVGYSAFYSQYDWLGRRFFVNLTMDFE